MKLYKYIGHDYINKVFLSKEYITFKCAYPKDFNDPYELFLTMDFYEQPKLLAFYSDVIGEIPQVPTTCFSRSPSVVPMWSHYAQNLQGFVIEVDEEKLAFRFPRSNFGDVHYQDKPSDSIKGSLYRAYGTAKFRHTYFLQKEVLSTAYFTKSTCWSYELERRMVIDPDETRVNDGLILMDIPLECITAIIGGSRVKTETQEILHEKSEGINCGYYEMKIGRSSSTPFFIDLAGNPFIFKEGMLFASPRFCVHCKEPLIIDAKECSWCMINKSHRISAAERNPFRMLDSKGMLESYIDSMEEIRHSHRKK